MASETIDQSLPGGAGTGCSGAERDDRARHVETVIIGGGQAGLGPRPSFVRFGAETERSTCQVFRRSPGRTGSPNVIVLSVITASGSASFSFRSKCTWRGCATDVRPGAQKCGRNHTEIIVGGAIQPPVSSSAVASSQKSGLPFSTDAHVEKM